MSALADIDRLLMLTAGPIDTDEQEAEVAAAIDVCSSDLDRLRLLAFETTVRTAEKMPAGAAVALTGIADLAALALLTDAIDRPRLQHLIDTMPPMLLPSVATALLGFWRYACSLVAMRTLQHVDVPDHAPTEGGR